MAEYQEELKVAEQYLTEMLEADRNGDYRAFVNRFEHIEPAEFNESTFLNDVELMKEELGGFKERVYLGTLNCLCKDGQEKSLRFVWRGIYDKNEALIVLGMHKKGGTWYVNENHVS